MNLKAHGEIFANLFNRSKGLTILIVVFFIFSISINFMFTDTVISFVSLMINSIIIGLLYGINVQRSGSFAEKIYNYTIENKKSLSDETMNVLNTGIIAKNTFWFMAFAMVVSGALNMYVPIMQLLTYSLIDVMFFGCIIYGLQASHFLMSFSTEVNTDILKEHMEKQK